MKRIIFFLSLTCCLLSCNKDDVISVETEVSNNVLATKASPLSPSEAQEIANTFFTQTFGKNPTRKSRSINISSINSKGNTPLAYIVNNEDGGWVIVSATQDYYPILAFSDKNQFTLNSNTNEGLNDWINETTQAIQESKNLDSETSSLITLEWFKYTSEESNERLLNIPGGYSSEAVMCRNRLKQLNDTYYTEGWSFRTLSSLANITLPSEVYSVAEQVGSPYEYTIVGIKDASTEFSVGPLTKTTWDQESNFNALCPNQYPAGCAAIAMAQIMKFHEYPNRFDWSYMPDNYATYASQYLIADIGQTVNMDYKINGSSASYNDIFNGFIAYGYQAVKKDHNSSSVANEIITLKKPVCMAGKNSLGEGHAWVCDGANQTDSKTEYYVEYLYNETYDNLGYTLIDLPGSFGYKIHFKFHMNWGWGGTNNGWFIDNDVYYPTNRKNIYVRTN